jgi:hypothetical protein
MTSNIESNKPLTPTMLAALRDLLSAELPRHGDYFVSAYGTKHMARTIIALTNYNYCRVCRDPRGHTVARVNGSVRSIVDAYTGVQRRARLAAEADRLARRELV